MTDITFIFYEKGDIYSGGYLYDKKLIDHLRKKGHDVKSYKLENLSYLENIKQNFSLNILEELKDNDPDIILQDELCHPSLFKLNDDLNSEIPIISIVHHLSCAAEREEQKKGMYKHFEKEYLKTLDGAICSSRSTKGSVTDLVELEDIIHAYPGKDHLAYQVSSSEKNKTLEKDQLRLLFVGNLLPHKCLDILVESMENLEDVKLTIIGDRYLDRQYSKKIEDMVEEKGLSSQIDILGYVEKDVLIDNYRKSHLLVLPSKFEGFGMTIVEGLRFGMPAIVTKRGGPTEIVRDGKEGLHVVPEDTEDLKDAIQRLDDDRGLLSMMSFNAGKRYHEMPKWKDSMEKINRFLKEMI